MQTLLKVKVKVDTVDKYSIKDIEPLIKSIIKTRKDLSEEGKELTEERICEYLEYNEGYISQLRSRENKEKKPQVSPKFYNLLKSLSLQNATNESGNNIETIVGEQQVAYETTQTKSAEYLAGRLDGKDDVIEQIEARRRDMQLRAEKAEKEKDRLLDIIQENLTELLKVTLALTSNLTDVKQDTSLGLSYQRAWVEYTAEDKAQGDKKKKDQTVLRMNKLLRSQIDRDQKAGKSTDVHKQSKEGQ